LKRKLKHLRKACMEDALNTVVQAMTLWTAPPQGLPKEYTLVASAERFACRPRYPDGWMLGEESAVVKVSGRAVRFPSIKQIVAAVHASERQKKVPVVAPKVKQQGTIWYAMREGVPAHVPPERLQRMLRQVRAKTVNDLQEQWQAVQIVSEAPAGALGDEFPHVAHKLLKAEWREHCLVRCCESTVDCTCQHARIRGHCVHEYAVAELEGLTQTLGFQMPPASEGQAELQRIDAKRRRADAGSSEDEDRRVRLHSRGRQNSNWS